MSDYKLADEDRWSHRYYFASLISNPITPLMAFLVHGVWLGWPLFILGGWIAGNPNYAREVVVMVVGIIGAYLLAGFLLPWFTPGGTGYESCLLALFAWKLSATVYVFISQNQGRDRTKYRDKSEEFEPMLIFCFIAVVMSFDVPDHFSEIGRLVLLGLYETG
ncbi:hypothetical protein HCH_00678 [Hahella chejuensis KCTC 2396]|uniref:Uncharacterized protein n=1 Tax=Hahella chejuensis (strain KCTC 2396) TaxID=349521 RepID=Q2SP46_HAHCH|nr:hypothetical protein [Hahella chejuensis]ABC27578.1 hypothetical protein HCH_00678 [Hahella chejuensis KCTC 2396]